MKNKTIRVAILLALGLIGGNQVQAQNQGHVIGTVRAITISADTDSSQIPGTGGEPIRFYTRNRAVAYFHDTGIGFQTSANFEQPVSFQRLVNMRSSLELSGNLGMSGRLYVNNRIGVGIGSPAEKIHVLNGNIRVDDGKFIAKEALVLQPDARRAGHPYDKIVFNNNRSEEMIHFFRGNMYLHHTSNNEKGGLIASDDALQLKGGNSTEANDRVEFLNSANEVKTTIQDGVVRTNEIRLNVSTFPDYVFANDYKLMPLEEVDAFIQKNKHLPNVPTETEVVKEGMNVGQINTLLVEKVEELTLYTIQQEKKIKKQEEQIQELLKRMNALENKN
ncbi:hypothetical protein [Tenacibaculum amylolyticum]|uniref:hypothetical protein n=1 Tax=Tenacibaculum amylolyticum TaxID=104269 RepID=UPI0038936630